MTGRRPCPTTSGWFRRPAQPLRPSPPRFSPRPNRSGPNHRPRWRPREGDGGPTGVRTSLGTGTSTDPRTSVAARTPRWTRCHPPRSTSRRLRPCPIGGSSRSSLPRSSQGTCAGERLARMSSSCSSIQSPGSRSEMISLSRRARRARSSGSIVSAR